MKNKIYLFFIFWMLISLSALSLASAYSLNFSVGACYSNIDPYSQPVSGIFSQNWTSPNTLIIEAYSRAFCEAFFSENSPVKTSVYVDYENNKINLIANITSGDMLIECKCQPKLRFTISNIENREYNISLDFKVIHTPLTPTCYAEKCSNGYLPKCEFKKNECVCESCPEIPIDMQSCLNNPSNYWDQETNSCHAKYSKDIIKYLCSDSDGGKNIYEYAHTFGFRSYSSASDPSRDLRIRTGGADSCISDKKIVENYCDENGFIQTADLDCPNGCKDGVCIKGEQITEKITCKFENSKTEQQCYFAGQWGAEDKGTKFCKADISSGSCVIVYSGYNGEQVTWKSSCGQYQYTTQDGNDEAIYFKCSEGETNITEIKNKGFGFAYWQCYDGAEKKSENNSSCKLSETWQKDAKDYCKDKCKEEKCGVNSFSVSQECYNDEISFKENLIGIENVTSEEFILNPEEVLVCKNSCPLDKKCYPFGYRKNGDYCSDESKFVEQLKTDKNCENNFECSSNICISGKCVDEGLIQRVIVWFKKLFG